MIGREKSGEAKEQVTIQSTTSCVEHGGGSVMAGACMERAHCLSLMI